MRAYFLVAVTSTAVYFGGNTEPFEVVESPEALLGIDAKPGAI